MLLHRPAPVRTSPRRCRVMVFTRYRGADGPERPARRPRKRHRDKLPIESNAAVQDRDWARLILGLDQAEENLTERREIWTGQRFRSGSIAIGSSSSRCFIGSSSWFSMHRPGSRLRLRLRGALNSSASAGRTRYPLNVRHDVFLTASRGPRRTAARPPVFRCNRAVHVDIGPGASRRRAGSEIHWVDHGG